MLATRSPWCSAHPRDVADKAQALPAWRRRLRPASISRVVYSHCASAGALHATLAAVVLGVHRGSQQEVALRGGRRAAVRTIAARSRAIMCRPGPRTDAQSRGCPAHTAGRRLIDAYGNPQSTQAGSSTSALDPPETALHPGRHRVEADDEAPRGWRCRSVGKAMRAARQWQQRRCRRRLSPATLRLNAAATVPPPPLPTSPAGGRCELPGKSRGRRDPRRS